MSIGAAARTVALGGIVVLLGACGGGTSSTSRLSVEIARNPGWTAAQLNRGYVDWAADLNRETTEGVPTLAGGDNGDDDRGGTPSGNADDPSQVSRTGSTEAGRVLLLCEFNTATLYVTYAEFQAMNGVQRRELRQNVRRACLA